MAIIPESQYTDVYQELSMFPVSVQLDPVKQKFVKKPMLGGRKSWLGVHSTYEELDSAGNYGIVIPEGLLVVDIDAHKGASRDAITEALGVVMPWDDSLLQRTVSGGEHHGFRIPDGVIMKQGTNLLGVSGLDTRTAGKGWIAAGDGYTDMTGDIKLIMATRRTLPMLPEEAVLKLKDNAPHITLVTPHNEDAIKGNLEGLQEDKTKRDPKINSHTARRYLELIPEKCWVDHDSWLSIGMALHHQFNGADGALEMWLEFSAKAEGYTDADQAEHTARWHSFDDQNDKANPVRFGTIIHLAGGPINIEAPKGELDAKRAAIIHRAVRMGAPEGLELVEELNADQMLVRFVHLEDGNRVIDLRSNSVMSWPDFKGSYLSSKTMVKVKKVSATTGKETEVEEQVSSTLLWACSEMRMKAVSTTFLAGAGRFCRNPAGVRCINLWSGWQRNDVAPAPCHEFLAHIDYLFGPRANDFLKWTAHLWQKPGELPHTAWLHISSNTGTGRGSLGSLLGKVFQGYTAIGLDLIHVMDSGFNDRLSKTLLVTTDEIKEGGSQKWKHSEKLKQMVTAEFREINPKGKGVSLEHNSCRWLMFSNHLEAIPLDDSNRRFEVVHCEASPKPAAYYHRLQELIADPAFIEGVRVYLEKMDISDFYAGAHAKYTAAARKVIEANQHDCVGELRNLYHNYGFELITGMKLRTMGGVDEKMNPKQVGYCFKDAGWIDVGRITLAGEGRQVVYARKERAHLWRDQVYHFQTGLALEVAPENLPVRPELAE